MPPLEHPREELVAQGLASGKSKNQAHVDAGYKYHRGNAAKRSAKKSIKDRVLELQRQKAEKVILTPAWVIERLVENVNRAMQIDAPKDEDGNIIGAFAYQGNVANRALELLAKTLGMLIEKTETTITKDYSKLSDSELLLLLAKEVRELELLERGQVIDAEA